MPFIKKSFHIKQDIKAFLFLMKEFNFTQAEAQRFISKGRIVVNKEPMYNKSAVIKGDIEVIYFEPKSMGLRPIFITKEFVLFDKPSGLLVHPNKISAKYSLLDEIRVYFGDSANAVHRIDMETSGVVLASRDKITERFLKGLFEKKMVKKSYLAWVKGKVDKSFTVEEPIKIRDDYTLSKHKVEISKNGKYARTDFIPLEYDSELNTTLVECYPITGRTHQIRVHLFHVKHNILGDPIYGTSFDIANRYLEGELSIEDRLKATKASRLLLHANSISFSYGCKYNIYSKVDFRKEKNKIYRGDLS